MSFVGAPRSGGTPVKTKGKNEGAPPPPPPGAFDKRPASIYPPPHLNNNDEKVSTHVHLCVKFLRNDVECRSNECFFFFWEVVIVYVHNKLVVLCSTEDVINLSVLRLTWVQVYISTST